MKKIATFIILFAVTLFISGCNNEPDKTVTMYFDSTGGSNISSITLSENSILILPDAPTKDGYIFDGWYIDEELTTPLSSEDITFDTTDITVYAKWLDNSFTLSFETNGGNTITSQTLQNGDSILLPTNVVKNGYNFYGWYTDSELTTPFQMTTMPDHNMTLYARWTDSDLYYTLNDQNNATITGIIPSALTDNVIIPSTVDGYPVVSIDYDAFDGLYNITSLTLPNSIQYLPNGFLHDQVYLISLTTPFVGSTRYSELNVPEAPSLDPYPSLGKMFYGNESGTVISNFDILTYQNRIPLTLSDVTLTDTKIIAAEAFAYTKLRTITLNSGVTRISSNAFTGSDKLQTIQFPDSLVYIEPGALSNLPSLARIVVSDNNQYLSTNDDETLLFNKDQTTLIAFAGGGKNYTTTIPDTVTTIGNYAFSYTNITSITIPNSVQTIGMEAFSHCPLLGDITFEANSVLEEIGYKAFDYADLSSITIPASVQTINSLAFANNVHLSTVNFESGSMLSTIKDDVFSYNLSLQSITIPLSVQEMGVNIFYRSNPNLLIAVEATTQPDGWNELWIYGFDINDVTWGATS